MCEWNLRIFFVNREKPYLSEHIIYYLKINTNTSAETIKLFSYLTFKLKFIWIKFKSVIIRWDIQYVSQERHLGHGRGGGVTRNIYRRGRNNSHIPKSHWEFPLKCGSYFCCTCHISEHKESVPCDVKENYILDDEDDGYLSGRARLFRKYTNIKKLLDASLVRKSLERSYYINLQDYSRIF